MHLWLPGGAVCQAGNRRTILSPVEEGVGSPWLRQGCFNSFA